MIFRKRDSFIREVFDYMDIIYYREDPLLYLIRRELYDLVRESYLKLNFKERSFINEHIFNEIEVSDKNRSILLSNILLKLLFIIEEKYYRKGV